MSHKRKIRAHEIVADIRGGLNGADIMQKYRLTPKGLGNCLKKLVEAGFLEASELSGDLSFDETTTGRWTNRVPRDKLEFPLPIFETENPEVRGKVRDITKNGVGVEGIASRENEIKAFVIPADEFFLVDPVVFKAECRWVRQDEPGGPLLSGFEIVSVSEGSFQELRKLLDALTLRVAS
ncbi:MAG: hypothetical protein FJ118_01780 [Deltaproteobacteria bacterium]|nr:hypothetical protein [Deltaproteobacteria bacterium]